MYENTRNSLPPRNTSTWALSMLSCEGITHYRFWRLSHKSPVNTFLLFLSYISPEIYGSYIKAWKIMKLIFNQLRYIGESWDACGGYLLVCHGLPDGFEIHIYLLWSRGELDEWVAPLLRSVLQVAGVDDKLRVLSMREAMEEVPH